MAFRKIILSCVALCVFPVLAYSMPICGQDLCGSKTTADDCYNAGCGDNRDLYQCQWSCEKQTCNFNYRTSTAPIHK